MRSVFKIWGLITVLEVITYGIFSVIIFMRNIDGAGVVQTPRIKRITWYLLSAFYAFFFIIQIVWFIIMKIVNRKTK